MIAQESEKTIRARSKLLERLEALDSQITEKRLEETGQKIRRYIADHAEQRKMVLTENMGLFNCNKDAVAPSAKIDRLREQLLASD